MLVPLIVAMVWMGLYPQPILRRTEAAAKRYVETVRPYLPAPAAGRRRAEAALMPIDLLTPIRRHAGAAAGRAPHRLVAGRAARGGLATWQRGGQPPGRLAVGRGRDRGGGGHALALAVGGAERRTAAHGLPRRIPVRERAAHPVHCRCHLPPVAPLPGQAAPARAGVLRAGAVRDHRHAADGCRRPTSSSCSSASRSCRSRCTCWRASTGSGARRRKRRSSTSSSAPSRRRSCSTASRWSTAPRGRPTTS